MRRVAIITAQRPSSGRGGWNGSATREPTITIVSPSSQALTEWYM